MAIMDHTKKQLIGGNSETMEEGASDFAVSSETELDARIDELVFRARQEVERALGEALIADLVELI